MKNATAFSALGLLGLLTCGILIGAEKPDTRITWEYKFATGKLGNEGPYEFNSDDEPNRLGEQGWELVSATVMPPGNVCMYYKRAK